MVANWWQEFVGAPERAPVDAHPLWRGADEIRNPPRLNLEPQPPCIGSRLRAISRLQKKTSIVIWTTAIIKSVVSWPFPFAMLFHRPSGIHSAICKYAARTT